MLGDKSSIDDIKYCLKKDSNNAVAIKNKALWESKYGDKKKIPYLLIKAKSKKYYEQAKEELEEIKKRETKML